MCKYCKISYSIGCREDTTLRTIATIRDGSQRFMLDLFRDITKDENGIEDDRVAQLLVSYDIKLGDHFESVKQVEINIKYCPFCGEKL